FMSIPPHWRMAASDIGRLKLRLRAEKRNVRIKSKPLRVWQRAKVRQPRANSCSVSPGSHVSLGCVRGRGVAACKLVIGSRGREQHSFRLVSIKTDDEHADALLHLIQQRPTFGILSADVRFKLVEQLVDSLDRRYVHCARISHGSPLGQERMGMTAPATTISLMPVIARRGSSAIR